MGWLDNIPMTGLIVVSIFLGLAPFVPEPHLFEKVGMAFEGQLVRPVDIFDLLMHGTPLLLIVAKLLRGSRSK